MRADIGELLMLLCETGRFLVSEQRRSFFLGIIYLLDSSLTSSRNVISEMI